MDSICEYGFRLTDKYGLLTEEQYEELTYNIKEFCFAIASQSSEYSENYPLALSMHWKGHIAATIYSDSVMTYFGIYRTDLDEVLQTVDVSDFVPSEDWLSRFLGRCERRIIERKNGNFRATIQEDTLKAWDKRLFYVDKNIPSNVSCRGYEVLINPNPKFIK